MGIILPFIYFLLFLFVIYKSNFFSTNYLSKKQYAFLFLIKVIFGVFLGLIYTYYYKSPQNSDTFIYYEDGQIIFKALFKNPMDYLRMLTGIGSDAEHLNTYYSATSFWDKPFNYNLYNDNRILIRINAVISIFSFGCYYVHTVFLAFLSFIGFTYIFKIFLPFLKHKKYMLLVSVFLIPSVLLWTSGVLKESVVMFALGIFIYHFFKITFDKFSLLRIMGLLAGFSLLFLSKFYILIAAIPGMIAVFWIIKSKNKSAVIKFGIVHLLFFLGLIFSQYYSEYNFLAILSRKQHDFINMSKLMANTGSFYQIPELHPTLLSLLKNAPIAFFNTLFRPFLFEIKSIIMFFSAFENILIILSLIFCLIFSRFKKISNKPLFLFCVSFVCILFILSGLITPVIGALVRYKVPALPFLFIALTFLFDIEKFKKAFQLLKNRF